jgi:hypothetical protein
MERSSVTIQASERELRATLVLRLPLDEVSAKIHSGPPLDDADDLGQPCWAGVIPLRLVAARTQAGLRRPRRSRRSGGSGTGR